MTTEGRAMSRKPTVARPTGPHEVMRDLWYYRYPTYVDVHADERDTDGGYVQHHSFRIFYRTKRVRRDKPSFPVGSAR